MGESGPVPAALGVLGEPVYRAVVRVRNRSFDRGRRVTRFPVPVISVGNLSVGGTGKTPMVMMLVEMLREVGVCAAIGMRGYKSAPGELGDEEAEYHDRLGDMPIVAQPDRTTGLRALLRERDDIGCVVLDDGFQHRFVARDLDVVLVDATRDPFEDRCLPRGWLREPTESLGRADVVVITRSDAVGEERVARLEGRVRGVSGATVLRAAHEWESIEVGESEERVDWLAGRRVVVVCAIGNGEAFVSQVERAGAAVVGRVIERDHHRWSAGDVERVRGLIGEVGGVGCVVTTGKDWVKLRGMSVGSLGAPMARPRLRMAILGGDEQLRRGVVSLVLGEQGEAGATGASRG